jgi:RNA polymerase sigma-70 factor (ECF subfamily)
METVPESTRPDLRPVSYIAPRRPSPLEATWNRAAHDGIARRHGPLLYQLARYLTANDSDARDLVQDTLERSLRKLPVGLPQDRIQCWLQVTLRNRFVDLRRSFEHRARVALHENALLALPAEDAEEEPRWTRVDPEAVWRCVERLNPILREVFLLRVRGRRSHAEIAAELGIPLSTVGTRYFRALRHLRRMLECGTPPSNQGVRLAG